MKCQNVLRMKTKNLSKYIRKYCKSEKAEQVAKIWDERKVHMNVFDTTNCMHLSLVEAGILHNDIRNIMVQFLRHEMKRGRLSESIMFRIMDIHAYECLGCLYDQPNQLAHMEPGGCLYSEENGFW